MIDMPSDGTCVRCGCAPRNAQGLCATCQDEDMCAAPPPPPTQGEEERSFAIALELERLNGIEGHVQWPRVIAAALRQSRDETTAPLREALERAQHLIRNLGGQHGELLDQIEEALK